MDDVHALLLPIWSSKTETARRLQQRLFRIFGFAKVKKWYDRDNPALWRGGLQEVMPDPYKIQKGYASPLPTARKNSPFL